MSVERTHRFSEPTTRHDVNRGWYWLLLVPFLSKSQARAKAKTTVRHMYNDMDYALDWYVGSCHRLRRNKIDCDYTITQEAEYGGADIDCDDTVRITKRSYGILWIDFPYEPDCY